MADDRPPLESFVRSSGRPPLESFLKPASPMENLPSGERPSGTQLLTTSEGRHNLWEATKQEGSNLYEGAKQVLKTPGEVLASKTPVTTEQMVKPALDIALASELGGRAGGIPRPGAKPVPIPERPPEGPMGVTLPKGPIPVKIGEAGQERVGVFKEQQAQQLGQARENVSKALDPIASQRIAETPQQAGQFISDAVQREASRAKGEVKQLYETAQSFPGEIHAGAFENFGTKIKGELALGNDPVIIDDMLTPYASRAIRDVDDRISQLKIQNRASPYGQPNKQNIVGVSLEGVDQMRKRLSAMRGAAIQSGNQADARAAGKVVQAFDNKVNEAINGGAFQGDPLAIKAYNVARQAAAERFGTYKGKGGTVAGVVEKIIGNRTKDPAIGKDVANYLWGAKGVNPSTLNVGVAKSVKNIVGEQSPEWIAAKQGLFERITAPGHPDPAVQLSAAQERAGHQSVTKRMKDFLHGNGKEMAEVMYSPDERLLLDKYADLHSQLDITRAALPEGFFKSFADRIGHRFNLLMAGMVGHMGAHGIATAIPMVAAKKGIEKVAGVREARNIARQLPLVSEQMAKWQRDVTKALRTNSNQDKITASNAMAQLTRSLAGIGVDVGQTPQAEPQPEKKPAYGGPME